MTTGRRSTQGAIWRITLFTLVLAVLGATAMAQGYDRRWRNNDGWGKEDKYGNRGRKRDKHWDRDGYRRGRSAGYPLDPRFRERSRDYGGRGGGRFEFRGRIDDEVIFFIRGGQVAVQNRAGRGLQVERWSLDDPLPIGRPVRLKLDRKDGRGRVQLLESPSPGNNYTAVVRVFDSKGGADRYHFRLDWR